MLSLFRQEALVLEWRHGREVRDMKGVQAKTLMTVVDRAALATGSWVAALA